MITNKIEHVSRSVKTEIPEAELCGGYGQYWSANNKKNPHDYVGFTFSQIEAMARKPTSVAKEGAPWLIPSTLKTRVFREQLEHGEFHALVLDSDKNPEVTFDDFVSRSLEILDCYFLAYTSRSATEENQKAHLIVPLKDPVPGSEYVILQKVLNDKFEAAGIVPDRKMERPGQLFYLPNKGEFYDHFNNRF